MSISYEEALATLQSMFADPWTRETLDQVLRHQQGHMENTVDVILRHGDKPPQVLVDQLLSGVDPNAEAVAADAQLARQLSASKITQPAGQKKGRGTPTTLPDDFLRVPNATPSAGSQSQLDSDEALARMLQDELFTQEISRNPDFAHLARGRGTGAAAPGGRRPSAARASAAQHPNQPPNPLQDVDIMKSLGDLGQSARTRLGMLAKQFNQKVAQHRNNQANGGGAARGDIGGGAGGSSGHMAERRGLLDDGDGEDSALEFASRKDM